MTHVSTFPTFTGPGFETLAPALPAAPPVAAPGDGGPTAAEVAEFAAALHAYRRRSGRMFPTWSEVLEVLRSLGYAKSDDLPTAASGDPGTRYRVEIRREGAASEAIGRLLVRCGGTPLDRRDRGRTYGFRTEGDRRASLELARAAHGWTSVEPRG